MEQPKPAPDTGISKTFDRGLTALEYIADNPHGITLSDVAKHLGVHRTIAHRLVGTLERHNLVRRSETKLISTAVGLIRLAESVDRDLQTLAHPVLQRLANELGATAHLEVPIGTDQAQALLVVEPTQSTAHIAFRAGQIHPLDKGSGGLAILAARPPQEDERKEVTEARDRGYAVSLSEVIPSGWGLSAFVAAGPGTPELSIGVTIFQDSQLDESARPVLRTAGELAILLGASPREVASA